MSMPSTSISPVGFYLTDPDWPGLDGNGNYDTILLGHKKYYINQVLSAARTSVT